MTEQILACPFPECKGERCEIYKDSQLWYVFCDTCGAEGPFAETEAEAIRLWNAAANQLAAKDAEIEQLRKERDEARRVARQLYATNKELIDTFARNPSITSSIQWLEVDNKTVMIDNDYTRNEPPTSRVDATEESE